jgi:type I restriction enzyme, S subunit
MTNLKGSNLGDGSAVGPQTEHMDDVSQSSDLPEGWVKVSLSEVVAVNPKHKDLEDQVAGFVPMALAPTDFNGLLNYEERQWDDIKKGYTHFATGDVIFAKVTPCFENGKAAIVKDLPNDIGAGSTEFYVLRPAIKDISVNYIFSVIKSYEFLQTGAENMTGAVGLRRVPKRFVEDFKINLPPLAEQKVIADKLDELLAQVESTKARLDAIPAILKSFRQSVLAAAVSGKLTEEWRGVQKSTCNAVLKVQEYKRNWVENNREHNEVSRVSKRQKAFVNKSLTSENLPDEWCWGKLEDSVLMIVDCHNKTAPYVEEGIPLIRTSNIRDGQFIWKDLRYVDQNTFAYWSKRCIPVPGDIMFTREAPMGEAAIIPEDIQMCLGQRTMLIRPIEDCVSAKYLLLAIMDPMFKKRSEEFAVGTGVKHYRVGDVSNLLVPVPPVNEQAEIVRRVEDLFAFADKVEAQVNAAQLRVNNLTQSILAKAFRGELTADWRAANPELITGENSANALLKRIKAERDALTKAKKPAKKAKA